VLTIDRASPPLALRLSMHSTESSVGKDSTPAQTAIECDSRPPASSTEIVVDDDVSSVVWVVARLIRKSDRRLLVEARGRGGVSLYWLPVESFSVIDEEGIKEKEKEKKKVVDKKGSGGGSVDVVEVILECEVDATAMRVPSHWRSNLPHAFNDAATSESMATLPFGWNLDILTGLVIRAGHDVTELETFNTLKREWANTVTGSKVQRSDKALAALAYLNNRKGVSEEDVLQGSPPAADPVTLLSQVLEKDVNDVKYFEDALRDAEEVCVHS
jgi:hypothetical protein